MTYTRLSNGKLRGPDGVVFPYDDTHPKFTDFFTWLENGGTLLPDEEPEVVVRQKVSNAALCMALSQMGMLGAVESFVEQLPFDAPAVLLWKKAVEFKRSDLLWDFFAPQLNFSSTDVDNLFNMAGQIDDSFGSE